MAQDEKNRNVPAPVRQSRVTSDFANSAVSRLNQRQVFTICGAKQFVVDNLTRSTLDRSDSVLDELRGHPVSVDAIIDIYVPAATRRLGQIWMDNETDFASVTVASMRL